MTTMTTGLLIYRILSINAGVAAQDVTRVGGSLKLTRVVRILIESGLLYTISVVVFFGTFLASNNAQYGVADVVVQVIPISFTLILIRIDQGIAEETSTVQPSTLRKPITFPGRSGMSGSNTSSGIAMSRSNVSGSQNDTYMMDNLGGDCDGWKVDQLDPMV